MPPKKKDNKGKAVKEAKPATAGKQQAAGAAAAPVKLQPLAPERGAELVKALWKWSEGSSSFIKAAEKRVEDGKSVTCMADLQWAKLGKGNIRASCEKFFEAGGPASEEEAAALKVRREPPQLVLEAVAAASASRPQQFPPGLKVNWVACDHEMYSDSCDDNPPPRGEHGLRMEHYMHPGYWAIGDTEYAYHPKSRAWYALDTGRYDPVWGCPLDTADGAWATRALLRKLGFGPKEWDDPAQEDRIRAAVAAHRVAA